MDLMYFLALVIIILISLYYYLTWNYDYWQKQGIPYDKNIIPGLGNIVSIILLRQNLATLCENYYKKHKKHSMFGFYQLRTATLLVREPELVKTVLTANFASFANNQFQIVNSKWFRIIAINPFFSPVETWKENRVPLSNAFSSAKLKFMLPLVHEVVTNVEKYLKTKVDFHQGKYELELKQFCNFFTSEIAATAIGCEGHQFQDETEATKNRWAFKKYIEAVFSEGFATGGIHHIIFLYFPAIANIFRSILLPEYISTFYRKNVKNILTNRKRENRRGNDFLQIMMDYYIENGLSIENNDALLSHLSTFATEAYETSAVTMSCFLFQLARHPEVQEKIREEVKSILEQCNGKLEFEDLNKMVYFEQALNESMRLNHVIGQLLKVCTKETQLIGSDGLSCRVKPGNVVTISTYGLQMDPDHWPDPEKFDPDRFSEEQKATRHKYTFIPFSEGPRICVAKRMATMVIKLLVSTVLNNYQIQVSPKAPNAPKKSETNFVSEYEGGFWVIFKPL